MARRAPAREVAKPRSANGFWIDHAFLDHGDLEWMGSTERLFLWNVVVPLGFLASIPNLWWIDLRGGTAADLQILQGMRGLRYLAVNQVRGLADLKVIEGLQSLEFLDLYGLPKVLHLPNTVSMSHLRRVNVGSMKNIVSLRPILNAPNLQELLLLKHVAVSESDVRVVAAKPSLQEFGWFSEDVPNRVWVPVVRRIDKPCPRICHPEEWFGIQRLS